MPAVPIESLAVVRPPVSTSLEVGFAVVCALTALAVVALLWRGLGRRAALTGAAGLALWLTLLAQLGNTGLFIPTPDVMPPLMARFLAGGALALVALAASAPGRRLAHAVPLWSLLLLQTFRLPLELVMAGLGNEGALPQQMTLHGWNFDILSGVLGLVLGLLSIRVSLPRPLVWLSQLVSLGLLVTIVFIAVRSLPGPTAGWLELPRNTLVLFGMWTWLPGLLVLTALFGHALVVVRLVTPTGEQGESEAAA